MYTVSTYVTRGVQISGGPISGTFNFVPRTFEISITNYWHFLKMFYFPPADHWKHGDVQNLSRLKVNLNLWTIIGLIDQLMGTAQTCQTIT